jgi:hypothetical protein
MRYQKELRAHVMETVKSNDCRCSVCIQHIDGGVLSFANMRGIKVSWGRDRFLLYIPNEITFAVPYKDIVSFVLPFGDKQIEIELTARRLLSIRGC